MNRNDRPPRSPSQSRIRPRSERLALAGIALAALALRLALWHTQSIVSVDGTVYIRLARALAGGPAFDTVQPPGYPLLILLAHLPVRDWVTAARVVDLAAGVAMVPLVWLLARPFVRSPWLRLAPAAAVAFLPLPVRYSLTTMSEAPYLAVLLAAFLLAVRKREFLAGLAGGAAYLIRPEALTAVAVLALFRARRPRRALLLLAGTALVAAPYVGWQGLKTGTWSLTRKTVNIGGDAWWQNEPSAGGKAPADAASRVERYGRGSVAAWPRNLAADGLQVLRHGGWAAPVVALAGLAGPAAILAAGLVQFLVTPFFAVGARARLVLPFLPFLWILAAAFLDRTGRRWRIVLGALCVAGLAITAVHEAPGYRVNEDGSFPELVEAGRWLRPHVGPATVIYDRKPYTAFYAGGSYRALPMGSYDQILDAVVRDGGDYVVVDQGVVDFFRPALLPLVLDKGVIWNESRLAPVYVNSRYRNRRTIVYRVVRAGGPPPLAAEAKVKDDAGAVDHGPNHYLHGLLAMRGKKWEIAAGEFEYVILRDSTAARALNNRAWCLLQAHDNLPSAEHDARRAVAVEPGSLDFLDTLAEVLVAEGKRGEADRVRARMRGLGDSDGGAAAPDTTGGGGP